jgi:signal transduction histidine kinase
VRAAYEDRGSFGLLNMSERAVLVGGSCEIQSAVGEGTQVSIHMPLIALEEEQEQALEASS